VDKVFFTVSPENLAARRIHEKLGAEFIATQKDYYHQGDTRLLGVISRENFRREALRAAV
jgi:RimJ/RimL family protein N-acetyltransferase